MIGKHTISFLLLVVAALLQTAQAQPTSSVFDAKQLLLDIKTLSADDMQGRLMETPGGKKAREYVLQRFKNSGLKSLGNSFLQPFEFTGKANKKVQGVNVIGYLKGKQTADKYIVVTAHYDHLGVSGGEIFNGADDNASGVAALFTLAAYFNKNRPANSIIFVALDAEEAGLWGAKKFVAAPPVKKDSIVMNVNFDMISHNNVNELYASGTRHYQFLKPYLEEVARTAPVKLRLGHDAPIPLQDDWTSQSDHFEFHKAKIPFIYFGVEDHADYHRPTDDFANINQTFYVHAVETVLEAIKKFDANLAQIESKKKAASNN